MVDFIDILGKKAGQQELAPISSTSKFDIENRSRLIKASRYESEVKRKAQPSYSTARKLFNKETSQDIIFDVREKNAFDLRQATNKVDPIKLKEDLDGVFGGNNILTRFLMGRGIADENLGKESGFFGEIGSRGVLGFFTGELLRSTPETEANLYEILLDNGATPEEAFRKAKARVAGDSQVLTSEEVRAINSYEAWDTAFKFLDAGFLVADIATLGTFGVVKPLIRGSARKGMKTFIKEASTMTNRNDLRKLVAGTYPELKGSQELEKMLDIVEEYPKDFSLLKAREDFKRTESFNELAKTISPKAVDVSTEAQRIIYRDGIPTLRKTTSDSLVKRRVEGLEAIKGAREKFRLSNADILQEEIKAGSLPLKTTFDDTISVWRVAPRGRRVKNGEEVSLVENFAKSISEGAKIEKVEVPVSDLVRLSDGTFTFAPERLIKEAPVLKFPTNISKTVVKATKKKEADIVAKKLAKEKSEKETKRKALEKAEEDLMRPVKEAQARLKVLEEAPVKIKAEADKKIVDIRAKRDLEGKGKTDKEIVTIKANAQKKIIDIRAARDLKIKTANKKTQNEKGKVSAIAKKVNEYVETKNVKKVLTKQQTRKSGKESLKPVGEGAVKESALYKSVQDNVRQVRKDLGEVIADKDYEFYRQASNKDQLAKATTFIEENGVEETIQALTTAFRTGGDTVEGVLNNSIMIALEPELLKNGMAKHAENLLRLSSRLATRMGQETQILSVLDRNNPLAVLTRLQNKVDEMVDGGGIVGASAKKGSRANVHKELKKLVEKVDSSESLKEAVDSIKICKV